METAPANVERRVGPVPRRTRHWQVGVMVLIGGVIGLAGAVALGRVALASGYVPALRASRGDPMQALRYE